MYPSLTISQGGTVELLIAIVLGSVIGTVSSFLVLNYQLGKENERWRLQKLDEIYSNILQLMSTIVIIKDDPESRGKWLEANFTELNKWMALLDVYTRFDPQSDAMKRLEATTRNIKVGDVASIIQAIENITQMAKADLGIRGKKLK